MSLGLLRAGLLLSGAALLVACGKNQRDAHCSPDSPDRATDESCIYAGTGKGPVVVETDCPPVEGEVPDVCPTFYDVLDVFADPDRGNCTSLGCHGDAQNPQSRIYLPVADALEFYESLLDAEGTVDRPYVVEDDPNTGANESLDSWMICNLNGERGGGFPMPPPNGMPNLADVQVIEDWILCGAPAPATCPESPDDNACVACAKAECCGKVAQCNNDADCAPCAACIAVSGDVGDCSDDCDTANARVDALFSCGKNRCENECPGLPQ